MMNARNANGGVKKDEVGNDISKEDKDDQDLAIVNHDMMRE